MEEKVNEIIKAVYDSLTDEQKKKADECKTMGELMDMAGKEGIELPDEALEVVSGGSGCFEASDPVTPPSPMTPPTMTPAATTVVPPEPVPTMRH